MKKVSRFEALAKGLNFITTPIKKKQIDNLIEKARLSAELSITEADSAIEKAAKVLVLDPDEDKLNHLCEEMQKRNDFVITLQLTEDLKDYFAQEVEVDDEKKK